MPRNDFPAYDRDVKKPILPDSTRVPWRPVGTTASLGAPVGIGMLHPMFGEVIAVIEVVVVLTIIATALFGSQTLSERAFRLLRWVGNRPEPSPPGIKQGDEVGDRHHATRPVTKGGAEDRIFPVL
jgi:hypothetical protein